MEDDGWKSDRNLKPLEYEQNQQQAMKTDDKDEDYGLKSNWNLKPLEQNQQQPSNRAAACIPILMWAVFASGNDYDDDNDDDDDDDDYDDQRYPDLEGHSKERHKEVSKGKTHLIWVFFKDLGDFNKDESYSVF